jgi:hypothetical protein
MTSTHDRVPITVDRPGPDGHEARHRFLTLVAEVRAAIQTTLTTDTTSSSAPSLERVVEEVLGGGTHELATVRVVG